MLEPDGAERNTFDGVTFQKDAVFHGSALHRGMPFTETDFDQALKAKGEDSPYKGRKQSLDRNLVIKMLDAGEGMTAVAKALGVSRQSIYRIKNEVTA